MNLHAALLLLLIPLLFNGCTAWRFAPKYDDALAKQFAVIPRKASVYVFRADSTNANPLTLAMAERHRLPNNFLLKPLCWLYPNTFLHFEVLEGTYTLMALNERQPLIRISEMLIGLSADELYFFEMNDRGLLRVAQSDGKTAVQNCALVKGQHHE